MGILKDAINRWYDGLNYFQQTLVQFFTSVLVLFAITGLGGLVFCGFESDQARPRRGVTAWDGPATWPSAAARVCGALRRALLRASRPAAALAKLARCAPSAPTPHPSA